MSDCSADTGTAAAGGRSAKELNSGLPQPITWYFRKRSWSVLRKVKNRILFFEVC